MTKTIVVASKNPVKILSTQIGFETLFPDLSVNLISVHAASQVSDQPMSDEETLSGAKNRASNAQKIHPESDFWVGIEGGCERRYDRMWVYAWVVVQSSQRIEFARSSCFPLPDRFTELLDQGLELGDATDIVFGSKNSKQKGGVVGALSHGHIDRTAYYVQPMILALMAFCPQKL